MENNLLSRFKKIFNVSKDKDSINNGFDNIFNDIEEIHFKDSTALKENIVKEIIELGDYIKENKIEITSPNYRTFSYIYDQLKNIFTKDFDFIEDSKEILLGLEANDVRTTEKFYRLLSSIELDFSLKISYKDGLIFSIEIPVASLSNNMKVLEVKSFIARAIINDALFIVDYFDFDKETTFTAGFVFDGKEYKPLKESFLKQVHRVDNLPKQEFFAFD